MEAVAFRGIEAPWKQPAYVHHWEQCEDPRVLLPYLPPEQQHAVNFWCLRRVAFVFRSLRCLEIAAFLEGVLREFTSESTTQGNQPWWLVDPQPLCAYPCRDPMAHLALHCVVRLMPADLCAVKHADEWLYPLLTFALAADSILMVADRLSTYRRPRSHRQAWRLVEMLLRQHPLEPSRRARVELCGLLRATIAHSL